MSSIPVHVTCLSLQGDTLRNVVEELCCIIKTGHYTFCKEQLFLEFEPPSDLSLSLDREPPPAWDETHMDVCREKWNSEQIGDFMRKLGFVVVDSEDMEKLECSVNGDQIKDFLYLNQVNL